MTLFTIQVDLFLLVFMRVTGMILFNPVFGRANVPAILKATLSLMCAMIITPTLNGYNPEIQSTAHMMVACLLELAIGLAVGVVINLLFAVVTMAGEYIDMQMGLGMAFMYDPSSGVSMPVVGSFFNALLLIIFFSDNAHLALFSLISDSFRAIAPGAGFPTAESARYIVSMGGDFLNLGLRMAIPVMAMELVSLIAVGMLMRAVPQINIFTVGIQVQAVVGILILLVSVPMVVVLCDRLVAFILEKVAGVIRLMAS